MAGDEKRSEAGAAERGGETMSEAEIDRNLMGTFPASDPPSWTLGTNHRHEPPPATPDEPAPEGEGE
jgi:hypothetical protein